MQVEVKHSPSFAIAHVSLGPGEQIKAEAGAMVSMSAEVQIATSTEGGFMRGLKRSLGGESFFMNTFTAGSSGGQVSLAPTLPGDIVSWELSGQNIFLTSGSYLASGGTIDIDASWGGAKTFFSREGLIMLRISGHGQMLIASYGAIESRDLAPGQRYTVDTGHMVGWAEGVQYSVRKVGSWKSTFLSGEGLVVDLVGPGRIYTQTRSADAFLSWLIPKLPSSG